MGNAKTETKMEIIKLDMAKYLGRGISLWLTEGGGLYFKPMEFIEATNDSDLDIWIGQDAEMNTKFFFRKEIEFIKSHFE